LRSCRRPAAGSACAPRGPHACTKTLLDQRLTTNAALELVACLCNRARFADEQEVTVCPRESAFSLLPPETRAVLTITRSDSLSRVLSAAASTSKGVT
jgi:hypothetical protein